jgi:hypothetical protein
MSAEKSDVTPAIVSLEVNYRVSHMNFFSFFSELVYSFFTVNLLIKRFIQTWGAEL